ncbi:MAG: helix-turn-helix domain-containing protein [Myxococcota bacterium]
MQKTTTRKIAVVVMPGGLSTAVAGPMDIFEAANVLTSAHGVVGPRFQCRAVGATSTVSTFGGLAYAVDPLPTRTTPDAILVAAAGVSVDDVIEQARAEVGGSPRLARWLRRSAERGTIIASGCVGTAWLAAAGLLEGRRATASWWLCRELAGAFPDVRVDRDAMVVEDGPIVTAGAAMAFLDVALHLVGRLGNPVLRGHCAEALLLDGRRRSQAMFATLTHLRTQDALVRAAAERMHRQPTGGEIPVLCRSLGVTPRTLQRRFQQATGGSPKEYWQRVRMEHARLLLETTQHSVAEIAFEVGYEDVGAFRRAFQRRLAVAPGAYRARLSQTR